MDKVDVNGKKASPVYTFLKVEKLADDKAFANSDHMYFVCIPTSTVLR